MDERILELIAWIEPYIDDYGYWLVFLGLMAENAALPVPGETILLLAAFFCSPEYGHLDLSYVIGLATVGAILGDNISFWVGRKLGRPFVERYGRYLLITPKRMAQVDRFFERYGDRTIFVQRWVTGLRVMGAMVAGSARMPWRSFLVYNCLGAITWVTVIALLGYFFALHIRALVRILERSGLTLLLLLVLIALVVAVRRRLFAGARP